MVLEVMLHCLLIISGFVAAISSNVDVDISMPEVSPHVHDTYLCVSMKAGDVPSYITGFNPHTNTSIAHHMLLYGCEEPFQTKRVWTCGEMTSKDANTIQGPVCAKGPKIIYAWAMHAKSLQLPEDVAFKVGGDSDIQWVVLQVHYKDVSFFDTPDRNTDASGIAMSVSRDRKSKRAGVYLMSTDGYIPAKSTTFMEVACGYNGDQVIHPFAFRTHAHTHGEVSSGYRIRNGVWSEIGRMSPKVPEMFYNITDPNMTFEKGDTLAARCTMVNNENRTVRIGQTTKDEMCNYYVMYWMSGDETLERPYCASPGPPRWSWLNDPSLDVDDVPSDASLVPGSTTALKATLDRAISVSQQPELLEASDSGYATGPFDGYRNEEKQYLGYDAVNHLPRVDDVIERQPMYDDAVENIPLDEDQKENLLLALEQLKTQQIEKEAELDSEYDSLENDPYDIYIP